MSFLLALTFCLSNSVSQLPPPDVEVIFQDSDQKVVRIYDWAKGIMCYAISVEKAGATGYSTDVAISCIKL